MPSVWLKIHGLGEASEDHMQRFGSVYYEGMYSTAQISVQ